MNPYVACNQVQDACNYSGVALSFKDVIQELCEERSWMEASHGFHVDIRQHPVALWWCCKMMDLSGILIDDWKMSPALTAVEAIARVPYKSDEHARMLIDYQTRMLIEVDRRNMESRARARRYVGQDMVGCDRDI